MSNENTFLSIYKGSCYNRKHQKKYQKIIVFDLDGTLGSFGELNVLWSGLNKLRAFDKQYPPGTQENYNSFSSRNPITGKGKELECPEGAGGGKGEPGVPPAFDKTDGQCAFNNIIDIYPEFLRYGILNILDYIYNKKLSGHCDKLFIYTNNICLPPWVSLIIEYIHGKLKIKGTLFDKIISAFKINNKIIELSRTQREKTCADLIRCTLLPKTTEICFIDDTYHRDMVNEKVYYIKPFPYTHGLSDNVIIERFINSPYGAEFINAVNMKDTFREYISDWFYFNNSYGSGSTKNTETDIFVSKKLMYHIKEFFYLTNRNNITRKKRTKQSRQTRKNHGSQHVPPGPQEFSIKK